MNVWYVLLSMLMAFGLAVALVEKGNQYPIKYWRIKIQCLLHEIHWKFPQVLYCTTCTSFWCALPADIVLCCATGFKYFLFPFSGFLALGFTWFVIEFLNAIEVNKNVDVK